MAQVAGAAKRSLSLRLRLDRTRSQIRCAARRGVACNAARGFAAQARCVSMLRGHAVLAGLTQNIHKTNEGRPATVRVAHFGASE